ncbi:sulfite exporter TauE/SafE family protein [Flavobacterium amniphilum]|uniref:sulfite exporter TauE/SafE family protein n=1 Tax=Flavobacterium amniphilum TaxID=1834035 RepID=UPI00202AA4BB|nr:sulfite exporter TauE/SafE family protein [Flavobacterium amniphilum]MCL9806228.1 sulfite exporter TauE/SafE family protein [Flavobacterium amniphilum]
MEYLIICITSLIGAGLTLFSGFGLGTLLLPVFGLFFPIEVAVVLTALVHFMNNAFKFFLFGKNADKNMLLKFGLPAIAFSFLGAYTLSLLTHTGTLYSYQLNGQFFEIKPLKLIIGLLLIVFALFDFIPKLKNLEFDKKYLSLGGMLSGFFGGLSGHQGALRSAFLIRAGLSKEVFIATGVVIACMVDISRLAIYIPKIISNEVELDFTLVGLAALSAFTGVYFGNKLLQKTTISTLQNIVCVTLLLFGTLMLLGII